ncbi:hypothetical protein LOD58_11235, partial [Xylella fastidiosa subsp. multiplex]|nr:hypothetical protein [Xylella fastidiosa subsp. multiplex]
TIRDWNAGNIPVLFAHPASAGHGLNLQDGGNILAFFGHWWAQVRNGVLMRTCTVCGGSGTVPISDRKRAAALGRDVSTYCMRWRGLYEWLLEIAARGGTACGGGAESGVTGRRRIVLA